MCNIRMACNRSSGIGWKQCDQQYRLRKAQNPTSSWAAVDCELWLLYVHSMQSRAPSTVVPSTQNLKCFDYNHKGQCFKLQCVYRHTCLRCYSGHSLLVCPIPQDPPQRWNPLQVRPQLNEYQKAHPFLGSPRAFQNPRSVQNWPRQRHYSPIVGQRQNAR